MLQQFKRVLVWEPALEVPQGLSQLLGVHEVWNSVNDAVDVLHTRTQDGFDLCVYLLLQRVGCGVELVVVLFEPRQARCSMRTAFGLALCVLSHELLSLFN